MQINSLVETNGLVAIGGGHGLGRLLSAFDFLENKLTGIVTTSDNGGSTGRLRADTGCIAWGDLRNCLSQLCREKDLKSILFDYRFNESSGSLEGHSLGNLMLLALDDMSVRPIETINLFRDFLNIKTRIIPMTEVPVNLAACDLNGCNILGEVNIDALQSIPRTLKIIPDVSATYEAIEAIKHADLILLGPGSFLTSVMPPLLLPQIKQAIAENPAPKILIANMVAENGPTGSACLQDKLIWMQQQLGANLVDAVIWPESRKLLGPTPANVYFADLIYDGHERLHDKVKLVNTVNNVYHALLNDNRLRSRKTG